MLGQWLHQARRVGNRNPHIAGTKHFDPFEFRFKGKDLAHIDRNAGKKCCDDQQIEALVGHERFLKRQKHKQANDTDNCQVKCHPKQVVSWIVHQYPFV